MKTLILVLCMTTVSYATEFKFETVSVGGALATIVDGLNDLEDVVGRYGVAQPVGVETGFLLSDGKSTALTINGSQVEPRGINENGVITGLIHRPLRRSPSAELHLGREQNKDLGCASGECDQ